MALIMETAGGVAETGEPGGASRRILDLQPTSIHQRKPIILGCKRDAEAVFKVSVARVAGWPCATRWSCHAWALIHTRHTRPSLPLTSAIPSAVPAGGGPRKVADATAERAVASFRQACLAGDGGLAAHGRRGACACSDCGGLSLLCACDMRVGCVCDVCAGVGVEWVGGGGSAIDRFIHSIQPLDCSTYHPKAAHYASAGGAAPPLPALA